MNDKFFVLSFVASVIKLLGYLTIASCLGYGVWMGLIEPNQTGHIFSISSNGLAVIASIAGIVIGLITVAMGEVIGVLFAIEKNTRKIGSSVESVGSPRGRQVSKSMIAARDR